MRLGEWLVHNGALTHEQVETALAYQARRRCKLGEAVLELRMMPREAFVRLLAGHLNVPFIRAEQLDKVPASVVGAVPSEVLARLRVCPLRLQQVGSRGSLYVATHQPENLAFLDEVSFATGFAVLPVLALVEDIDRTLRRQGVLSGRRVEPIELPPAEDLRVDYTRFG
ncbi:MAG: pilus assembly protein PilB [Myxococcaceae bacterium]|nr:pilus assembly protein PilB [Myxococcaceae bacterium]